MAAAETIVWEETWRDFMAQTRGRAVFVEDGTFGHWRPLRDGETVAEALADYAAGYRGEGRPVILVTWATYLDGVEQERGAQSFVAA